MNSELPTTTTMLPNPTAASITYCTALGQECHACLMKTLSACGPILQTIVCLAAMFGLCIGLSYLLQVINILQSDPSTIGYRLLFGLIAFAALGVGVACIYGIIKACLACHQRIRQRQRQIIIPT